MFCLGKSDHLFESRPGSGTPALRFVYIFPNYLITVLGGIVSGGSQLSRDREIDILAVRRNASIDGNVH
jgi:hypothetical protein